MDRSLSFFVGVDNQKKNIDSKTGLPIITFTETANIVKFDSNDPTRPVTDQENKTYNYSVIQSSHDENVFVNYLGNSATNEFNSFVNDPEHESDIKLSSIINWTQTHPSMKLRPADIAYLKNFNTYPANRLMVLRRFGPGGNGIGHNLFKTNRTPNATLVSYYNLDEPPMKIKFSEEWDKFNGSFLDVIQDVVGINFNSVPGLGPIFSSVSSSPIGQDMMYRVGQKLGMITNGSMPYGDPNLIHEAAVRAADGETLKTGLKCDISIEFESTYVFNEINGVSGKVHMMEMIALFTKMGTSNARYLVRGAAGNTIKEIFKELETGNIEALTNRFVDALKEVFDAGLAALTKLGTAIKTVSSLDDGINLLTSAISDIGSDILKTRYQRYKWKLIGAFGAMTGSNTAPWHITVGNPKFPWFVCGNLVVEDVEIIPGGELSYDDMFTELTVKIKLKNGRAMGASEIQSLFNIGNGRIYDEPKKIKKIVVPKDTEVIIPQSNDATINPTAIPGTETNNQTDTDARMTLSNSSNFGLNNKVDPINKV